LPVVAGCTDGTAGCLASGACEAGDLNVTLGSTLVFKAVSDRPLQDPQAAIYNHRHPAGGFLPGAASSTGGEWIAKRFAGSDWDALGRAAAKKLPAERVVYPLVGSGERFPFVSAAARGFGLDAIDDPVEQFAAGMEGVAFLERIGIERLEGLGLPIRPTIFATGGGTSSSVWLAIRAAVNRREYSVPAYAECAVGAAVLAAMPQLGSCRAAVNAIVRSGRVVKPDGHLADAYDASYRRFCGALRERGYL
jgi:xylulokinase